MAKIVVPNVGTKFDPVAQQVSLSNDLGLVPVGSDQKFSLDPQTNTLNSFSNVKASDYGDNISLYNNDAEAQTTLDERRAQQQSSAEQLLKGLGHVAATMGTEILKTPGYLLGGFGAAGNDKSIIENIVDNDWVNTMESLDTTLKDQLPVYLTKDVQEGNIGKKLMSSAWWATTGADGIGFLLSMYAPGRIVGALGAGQKIGAGLEALAQDAKLAKVLTASNILKQTSAGAKMTEKGIARINSLNAVALNTYIESASEAANTFDTARKNYFEANPQGTDEEASKVASDAAANVMKANVAVLALSNVFDELFLFKGFGRSAEETAKNSTIGKLFDKGVLNTEAISKIKKEGIKEFFQQVPGKLAANFAKEGLFEEGLQTQIQKHYENTASGKTKATFSEDVFGNYFENLMNDPDMQESVVLGGILGGGASMFGLASDIKSKNEFLFGKGNSMPSFLGKLLNKKEKNESKGFVNIMNENFINSTRTILDVAETGEDGKPIFENGKVKVNEAKLKDLVEQKEGMMVLNQLHNLAILEGNKTEQDYYGDLLNYNYFLPFLQQEGGYEVLQQHISNQLVELMGKKFEAATGTTPNPVQVKDTKERLLAKAAEYKKIYDEVHTTTNTELYVPVDNRETYLPWKNQVRDKKMQALVAYGSASKALAEIDGQFSDLTREDFTKEELDRMGPAEELKYRIAQKVRPEYEARAKNAKQAYLDLSNKTKLRESYNAYKNNLSDIAKAASEEVANDENAVNQEVVNAFSADDFEAKINRAGYETKQTEGVKGFYLPDQRIILADKNGKRVTLEAQYNASTKTVEYVTKDVNGKITKVTNPDGSFTPQFISKEYIPVTKEQISKERMAIAVEQRKKAQLALLDEFISYRNSKIASHQKELEEINKEIEDYDVQLNKTKEEIRQLFANKVQGKLRNKRQFKINKEALESTLNTIESTIANLQNRKEYLLGIIPRIEALIAEYQAVRDQIVATEGAFSFKRELEAVEKLLQDDGLIVEIRKTIDDINARLVSLEAKREAIKKVLLANSVFDKVIRLKEKEYEKAYSAFDRFFDGIPFFYSIRRIHEMVTSDPKAVISGDTLVKNNIMSNVVEITKWLNSNPIDRHIKFGNNDLVTEEDIYQKMIDIFTPYVANTEELTKQYPYTPEEIYDLKSQVFITGREIDELNKQLVDNNELLNLDETYRKYIVLQRLVAKKVEDRYNTLRSEIDAKNVESSQKQDYKAVEPAPEANMRDVFLQHALPQTPFSTTGKSVLYEKDGNRQGKDKIDENGFPVLNDNTFQRLWFYTIDKLADEISEYTLTPVHAKYDGSDDIQRTLEANFPDESQRTDHDVFVFLTDKKGDIVRVDNQGNRLTTGGTPVFSSIRKTEEVFPPNQTPRISPDYILRSYLDFLKLGTSLPEYNKIKDKKIADVIGGKDAREKLKSLIDNDNTVGDLFNLATNYAKGQYEKFVNDLITSKNAQLKIEGVSKGYPLYQLDRNGKRVQNKPLTVFKNAQLKKGEFGTKQLEGAKLGVIVNSQIKSGGRFISLPEGSVYIQFANDDFATLQSRTITPAETKTIMYLLSLANTTAPLNTITVDLPKKKDGSSYYYFLNNRKIESPVPVFFRKTQTGGESFSLLETMINYGLKGNGKNKKGELYIQGGKVVYTTFEGEKRELKLTDLDSAVKANKFENHNPEVEEFYNFLLQKRFNVNNTMLANNPLFFYPTYANGKLSFDNSKTYYDFLLNNALTTSATIKEGYPTRLQRNIIYSPTVESKQATKTIAPTAPEVKPSITQVQEPAVVQSVGKREILDKFTNALINAIPDIKTFTAEAIGDMAYGNDNLALRMEDINDKLTPADVKYITDKIFNSVAETPVVETAEPVVENEVPEVKEEPVVKETTAQRLARLRGESEVKLDDNATPSVDKRIDPEVLIEQYIKDNIVQKICK